MKRLPPNPVRGFRRHKASGGQHRNNNMHYYQFNIGDYRKDTQHLSPIEHYIYRQLIDSYYLDERPIPKETQPLLRRLSLGSEHEKDIQNILEDFFVFDADCGVWRHLRIDHDISEYRAMAEKNARNGKKGGRPKKEKPKKTQSVSSGNPDESQKKPNQELETNNQEPRTSKTLDQSAIDHDALFDRFWASGIRKVNKKKAKSIFDRLIKSQPDPDMFADNLCQDVQKRIASGQLGFTEMHPTTYLNGERWNDDIQRPQPISGSQKPLSASERVRQAISEKQAARSAAGGPGGDFGGQAMADAGGHVRSQAREPVRGDSTGCVGEVLEGDFWSANS